MSKYFLVEELRQAIRDLKRIPENEQVILFGLSELENGKTLSDSNIRDGSTIDLFTNSAPCEGQIFIRFLNNKKRTALDIEPSDSIESIKSKIMDKEEIPPDQQSLIFRGTPLEEDRTILDYLVVKDSSSTSTAKLKRRRF